MKKLLLSLLVASTAMCGWAAKYQYRTVDGDPMATKIYTLPNGLTVYMSVNKDEPRVQANIAVRVGGKNDPAETTGLAHYFEHLMFKGTPNYGTQNYAAEKPLLDQIEQLFETYRHTTDSTARRDIYRQIDSISYQASLIAIPNEYDKLMAAIGANGTNAYTSQDVTCYVENIPSNQLENWAKIQADRFKNPVLRGFHTELETIYEEKNMSLTQDNRKMAEAMLSTLFPSHPYGTQTVLGTQEHLKNPSITNVKNYHAQWYVPNNMAILLSGDFDPDQMVDIITRHFGDMKPNPALKHLEVKPEAPITSPIKREVLGPDSERLYLAWRTPEAKHSDMLVMQVLSQVLSNGKSGLIDVNLNNSQKVLGSGASQYGLSDQGAFILIGVPNPGQSLDQVSDLLLGQLDMLRKGEFDAELIPAIVNNLKLRVQSSIESNDGRVDMFTDAFVNGEDWADMVAQLDKIEAITKDDVVRVANQYLGPQNYVAIHKLQGEDTSVAKIAKPSLTPIATNRDKTSDFLRQVQQSQVQPIEPVFLDFDKDITVLRAKQNIPVVYTRNTTNDLATLMYVFDYGSHNDKRLSMAARYFDLIGTDSKTYDQIQAELYKLACSVGISIGANRSYFTISGLSENLPKAAEIFENWLKNAKPDQDVYNRLVEQVKQGRKNTKANQRSYFAQLRQYVNYGPDMIKQTTYTNDELATLDPAQLVDALHQLAAHEQKVIYYGNLDPKQVIKLVNKTHITPKKLIPTKYEPVYYQVKPEETVIYIAPYNAKQLYMTMFANLGGKYDLAKAPLATLYNEYFGGSMNSIVFQEMRESRSLAYSAGATLGTPSDTHRPYSYQTSIATQNDKMLDAIDAFLLIINDMPQSEDAFKIAKQGLESQLRSERIIKDAKAWEYLRAKDRGINTEQRKTVYDNLGNMTLADVVKFQQDNVKGLTYYYGILGDPKDLDLERLAKYGRIVILTPEDVFGY